MFLQDFSFKLPKELIATKPAYPRDSSRLLFLKNKGSYEETQFFNLCNYLKSGDLLVINDTRVNVSKISGIKKGTKIYVDFTIIKNEIDGKFSCLALPGKKVNEGDIFIFDEVECIVSKKENEKITLDFGKKNENFKIILEKNGIISLPPYISKIRGFEESDKSDYQTIYSKVDGSIAAPTAGLHFTKSLLEKIKNNNIDIENITLDIGPGTFLPLRKNQVDQNKIHSERFYISEEITKKLNEVFKNKSRRIISVGTTTLRALESSFDEKNLFKPINDDTDIFIYPGKKVKSIDALITNFHLPESSLFLLICSLIGTKTALKMYQHAIDNKFRFYSYGDACFLLNKSYD